MNSSSSCEKGKGNVQRKRKENWGFQTAAATALFVQLATMVKLVYLNSASTGHWTHTLALLICVLSFAISVVVLGCICYFCFCCWCRCATVHTTLCPDANFGTKAWCCCVKRLIASDFVICVRGELRHNKKLFSSLQVYFRPISAAHCQCQLFICFCNAGNFIFGRSADL